MKNSVRRAQKATISASKRPFRPPDDPTTDHPQRDGLDPDANAQVESDVLYNGIYYLHPPPEVPSEQQDHSVDIVSVHGLNGHARRTWTDKSSNMLWLEDFLPKEIPDSRIMTHGYASQLTFSQSKAGIEETGGLLDTLRLKRQQ